METFAQPLEALNVYYDWHFIFWIDLKGQDKYLFWPSSTF